jgi:hypothetical protein
MFTTTVPHKNHKGKPRNPEVSFDLSVHEFLKLLVEFKKIFEWQEAVSKRDGQEETPTEEVVDFYTNFEEIVLAAWGEMDAEGDHFRKGGVFDYRESSTHHAAMLMFLKDQEKLNKMLESLMPDGLEDLIKSTEENLAALAQKAKDSGDKMPAGLESEVERIKRDLAEAEARAAQSS